MASSSSAPIAAAAASRKLRVLMLHGYLGNADYFRLKTAALRKALSGVADFDYIQAPHEVTERIDGASLPAGLHYSWWNWGGPTAQKYAGVEQSVEHVRKHVEQHGSYDVYFGFSQGSAFVGLLAALASAQKVLGSSRTREMAQKYGDQFPNCEWFLTPRPPAAAATEPSTASSSSAATALCPPAVMCISGFIPRVSCLRQFFPAPLAADALTREQAQPAVGAAPDRSTVQVAGQPTFQFEDDIPLIDCPSLHIFGRSDADVSPLESDALRRTFLAPQLETSDGGHHVPNNADFCRRYKAFFATLQQKLQPQ